MPKDTKKYRYHNVGLIKDSYTDKKVQEDAELHHMGDQPAKLMALRLTEYYRLVDLGVIVPGMAQQPQASTQTVAVPAPATQPHSLNGQAAPTPTEGAVQVEVSAEAAEENAEAAVDIWTME